MGSVVKSLESAINSMELEKVSRIMDKFEQEFEDLDVHTSVMEGAMGSATTISAPGQQVDDLIRQVAEESGLDVAQQLASVPTNPVGESMASASEDQDPLSRRLAALRE